MLKKQGETALSRESEGSKEFLFEKEIVFSIVQQLYTKKRNWAKLRSQCRQSMHCTKGIHTASPSTLADNCECIHRFSLISIHAVKSRGNVFLGGASPHGRENNDLFCLFFLVFFSCQKTRP